uniref:Uncharacterized protein n=1 Tax=Tetradesmus obliquus TaxID=3088 RepID=A0A383VYM6_TETOB|eukprot:jgi/Sobl393_1/13425/SZX69969.1
MQDHEGAPSSSTLLALPIVVEHPAISSSPKILCAAACVCKYWQQGVQQCAACNTDVHLRLSSSSSSSSTLCTSVAGASQLLPKMAGFGSWLAKHGLLVRSLTLDGWPNADADTTAGVIEAAVQLVRTGMLSAAAACYVYPVTAIEASAATESTAGAEEKAAAAIAARCSGPQQQQQQPWLRLSSFSSDAAWAVGLLPVLPAHSLTRLELDLKPGWPAHAGAAAGDAAALIAALPRLGGLQQLLLRGKPFWKKQGTPQVDSCLAVLGQLSRLTRLKVIMDLRGHVEARQALSALQQLLTQPPPRLQDLHLDMRDNWSLSDTLMLALDMSRMQHLQRFVRPQELPKVHVLPRQLRDLELGYCGPGQQLAAVMPLQQLTALSLDAANVEPEQLLRLAQLPALQELRLLVLVDEIEVALATAPVWGRLPQLCELQMYWQQACSTWQELAAGVAGIVAAKALTKLYSWTSFLVDADGDKAQAAAGVAGGRQPAMVEVCASIAGLTRLQHLELIELRQFTHSTAFASGLVRADVWHLTALTALTHLALPGCDLCSMACLGPIAQLPHLTELQLQGNPRLMQQWLLPGTPVAITAAGRQQAGVLVGGLGKAGTTAGAHTRYRVLLSGGLQLQDIGISDIWPVEQRPAQPGSAALLRKLLPFIQWACSTPGTSKSVQRSSTGQGPWEAYLVPLGPDQQPRKVAIGSASSAVLAAIIVATALAQLGYRYTPDDSSKQLLLEDEGLIAELL